MDNISLVVWDTDKTLPSGYHDVVLWQNIRISDSKVSISQLVEENSDHLRSAFLGLIFELGETVVGGKRIVDHLEIRPGFSYWWMTSVVEKNNYVKSSQIDNIVKLIALRDWLKARNFSDISLVSSNTELAAAIQLLAIELRIGFKWKEIAGDKESGTLTKRLYRHIPKFVLALVWLARHLITRWSLRGVGLENWKNSRATITFASYLFNLDPESTSEGLFESKYWDELPEMLGKEGVLTNWIHIYIKGEQIPTAKAARELIMKFNHAHSGTQNHVVLDSFISVALTLEAARNWYRIGKIKRVLAGAVQEKCGYVWPLLKSDFYDSMIGPTAMSNMLYFALFENAMSCLQVQTKGLYLQEYQSWESAFIHSWRSAGHGRKLMGVPHSTICYWDLRHYFDSRSYASSGLGRIPLPDLVCVNGEEAKGKLLEGGFPLRKLAEVEALRYLYLNADSTPPTSNDGSRSADLVLLVVCDYLNENTKTQMELLQDASKYLKREVRYIVKPHPFCSISVGDYPELKLEVSNDPIFMLIERCSLVYSSNVTSAAVDAYCMGKVVVTLVDLKCLNWSPLKDRDGVSFVVTPEELAAVLNGYDVSQDSEVEGAGFFYLGQELPRWRKLISIENLESGESTD